MNDPLKELLDAGVLETSSFGPESRYHETGVKVLEREGQDAIVHLKRRFVPAPERFSLVQEHVVVEGDRPDNLAASYLGDPLLYWRLCDANSVIRPGELTEAPGRRIAITLPQDVPGDTDER